MILTDKNTKKEHLYMEVYHLYKNLILEKKLAPGTKMPSLRRCSQELKLSRTTIETAYLQLAADGYIISRPQSGYYVTEIASHRQTEEKNPSFTQPSYQYDFASAGVDRESFRFDLWSRYIKSALRQDERLLTYGEAQGEADFRQVLAEYIREKRNIICSPDDIVVGASVQSLLQILCPLIRTAFHDSFGEFPTVSFPTPSFLQGYTIFEDYHYRISYRDKECNVIYVSPAHMTKWGEVMPYRRRLELIHYAADHGSLIIEDDYENEFVYQQKPTPSLFGLSGGENVVYIGSFSRLLLPSIRISFMVLPHSLLPLYQKKAANYNQTASKAEQIALCQFIRDGHLSAQSRKLRRLYLSKQKKLMSALIQTFGEDVRVKSGAAGTSLGLTLEIPQKLRPQSSHSQAAPGLSRIPAATYADRLKKQAQTNGLHLKILKETSSDITLLLSCSSMPVEDFLPACVLLKKIWENSFSWK